LNRVALLPVLLAAACFVLSSCGSSGPKIALPPSGLTTRVLISQSVSTPTALPGLLIVNGENDTRARGGISAGASPGLMTLSPDRATLLSFDSSANSVDVINTEKETQSGSFGLGGATTSMVALSTGYAYAAVPTVAFNAGTPPGAVVVMNYVTGGIAATISVPGAQTVVASPDGTVLLAFSNDSNSVTALSPLLVNTGSQVTTVVPGFDRPVYAVFSSDSSTAYILNCGPECGSGTASASVQVLNVATLSLVGTPVPVDGATIGWLNNSTLYVAGNSVSNPGCTGQATAAATCGRLDAIDLGSMTVTGSVVITDGYHDRIDMSVNGQLFVGSYGCTNIGNVNNPQGEVRGCLSIFDTTTAGNTAAVIPPDNGDVTGLQSFTTRDVEYVAEGGTLRVYDTLIDSLLENSIITTGTITVIGVVIDVKAIDFF
jgi:hypothetical protein